ncbi:MAG: chemotaxis protein CheA [Clostridiales bacterium GWF2_36_10]|nr:MAG: chemotaxis protein CheA [Clostridiales bacterium GWF2_36_10]HAN21107.1 chemotaxis protein CheA [Clostridiales bacterium]
MAEQINGDSLLEMFIFETLQNTEQLEKIILETEKNGGFSDSTINEIFRIMHTLKGSSAMMSYSYISSLAHKAEDLFYYIRENPTVSYNCSRISDLILLCMDYINREIDKIKENNEVNFESPEEVIKEIENVLIEIIANRDNIPTNNIDEPSYNSFKVIFYFEEGCEMENIRSFSIIRDIQEYTKDVTYIPDNVIDNDDTALIIRQNGFAVSFRSDKSYSDLHSLFSRIPFIRDIDLTLIDIEKCTISDSPVKELQEVNSINKITKQQDNQVKTETHQSTSQSIISINVSKLDKLMNLMGEVVIAESMVVENPDLKGLQLQSFQREALQLHKIIVEMQDMVMSMRLVPLTTTFQKTHRIVRDMSKKLDKEVKLEFIGEETEVDKKIIEHLSDPLLHLVRNCIDHGLESEKERIEANKPPIGTITLEAFNAGSYVYILVKDDGKGINKTKVLEKAKKNNLLIKPESEMTDREICNLIFLPGFSTNEQVSEFSGRGVGMDVVMQSITSVGGSVSVDSIEGKGTTITMKIPLTVAIIDGMNIEVGRKHFTIPITAIKESFKPNKDNIICDTDGNEMIMVRGECYAIMKLYKQWDIETRISDLTDGILIMVEQEEKKRCIFADSLLGQQQVVVKSMPDYIRKTKIVEGISGCTLLGDGSISLILDAGWLINSEIKYKKEG